MDVRRIGIWMVALGGAALTAGLVTDAVQHANDATLASREGVFDLSRFAHALFFGGICVALLGVFVLLAGARLYGRNGRVTVSRRLAQVVAPVAAVVLVAATAAAASNSALGEPNVDAAASDDGQTIDTVPTASESDDHDHGDGDDSGDGVDHGDHGPVIEGTATGDSPCEIASPTPASPGQVGTGDAGSEEVIGEHGSRGMVKQEPLTREERVLLEEQMRQARSVIDRYPTVADAEAAGYKISTPYVPCIGAHYTNVALVPRFDPAAPSELLFDGTNPDSKIVGLSYLVWHPGGPPEGFAGENDHWHQHNANGGLCFGGGALVIGGEELSEEECAERGGEKRLLPDIWMAHAWVAPGWECSWGVFAGECPELGGRVAGTAWDEPDPDAEI